MSAYGSLQTTARAIRRSRPLSVQKAIAARGENPMTGNWWPFWKEWHGTTDPVARIMSRWSGARARYYGRLGGLSRSLAKAHAARVTGRRYGHLGGRPRARKQTEA